MRFPPAPTPFTDRITCIGTLAVEGRRTGSLDILIDVSPTAAHEIRGWVLGNLATKEDIERTLGRHHGAVRLDASTGSQTLSSESVLIRSTQYFGADRETMPQGLHGVACVFECVDLTRRFDLGGDTATPRQVRFLLRGPRVRGVVHWSHGYSFKGAHEVRISGGKLATGGDLPFTVWVLPHFLHDGVVGPHGADEDDNVAADAGVTSETNVLAMACHTRKSVHEYRDETFLADARQAVQDLCLLFSLLAGGMITWHGYFQSGSGHSIHHNRSLAIGTVSRRSEEIVSSRDLRKFLRGAFRRLRRLREAGIDLEMPIVSAIAGAQARVARQRFGEFFLALEALHSIHLESTGETFVLQKGVFRKLQDELKEALAPALRRRGVRSAKILDHMSAKLGELNRPPLWRGIHSLMNRLRVDWEDLYPEPAPERPTFLKLRNTLFHSHSRAQDEVIYKEAIRVEAVVHRILLRWLGWKDLWNAPPPEVRHYLSGEALPSRHRLTGRTRKLTRR